MYKKIFLSLMLAFSTLLFTIAPAVHAQTTWWDPTLQEFGTKVSQGNPNDIFGERYTYAQVNWIILSLITIIEGKQLATCSSSADFGATITCLSTKLSSQAPDGPILALASWSDSFLKTKPASGVDWTTNLASNLRLIPEAKAQGYGFKTLSVAATLWKGSRNFAYALMTIAIVILAFMIMFRVKISPQASVTVQSAIPKVAIGLVLITFSYAIAGFLVDLAFVAQGIIGLMFNTTGISGESAISLFNNMNNGLGGILTLSLGLMVLALVPVAGGLILTVTGVGAIAGTPLFLGGILLIVLIFIALFISIVRIFWLLLKTYVVLLLLVIAAPFFILFSIVSPGFGFGGWFRTFIANLIVFPTVSILILFGHMLLWSGISTGLTTQGSNLNPANPFWIMPINAGQTIGGTTAALPTLGGGIRIEFISYFAAFFLLMSIVSITNVIKALFESGRLGRYESAVGQTTGVVTRPVQNFVVSPATSAVQGSIKNVIFNRLGVKPPGP
ncbi:MAG: hypothetical protein HY044_00975 [Candidatus Woesebacteria bacterium]|nr:MAG: hypothetical protein HY044_00975 [Candidatus Woesebacteria bacterium]